jgi:hypothetical protein
VRIFVEWTWGMFFPADITHQRFPGSQAVAQLERDEFRQQATVEHRSAKVSNAR